jgi:hypothetical protein
MLCALFFSFNCKTNAKEKNPMQKKEEVGYQRLDGLFSDEGKGKKKKKKKRLGLSINFYLLPPTSSSSSNGVLWSQNWCNEVKKRHIQHLKELVVTCVTCLVVVAS